MYAKGRPYNTVEPNADRFCYFRGEAIRKAVKMGERFGINTSGFEEWAK